MDKIQAERPQEKQYTDEENKFEDDQSLNPTKKLEVQAKKRKMNLESKDFLVLTPEQQAEKGRILQLVSKWPIFQASLFAKYYLDYVVADQPNKAIEKFEIWDHTFVGLKPSDGTIRQVLEEITGKDSNTATAISLERSLCSMFSRNSQMFPNLIIDMKEIKFHELDSVGLLTKPMKPEEIPQECFRQVFPENMGQIAIEFPENQMYYLEIKKSLESQEKDKTTEYFIQETIIKFKDKIKDFFLKIGKKDVKRNYVLFYNKSDTPILREFVLKAIHKISQNFQDQWLSNKLNS